MVSLQINPKHFTHRDDSLHGKQTMLRSKTILNYYKYYKNIIGHAEVIAMANTV